ncbi:unnamed protein product [Scytosiphon promiscuus]
MDALSRTLRDVETRSEDPQVGIRYLENIVLHPHDLKFRSIKKANRKFFSEVWLQPGVRTTFLAVGFREEREGDGTAVVLLDPFTDQRRRCVDIALQASPSIQARRRGGRGAAPPASGTLGASHPDAGNAEPRQRQERRARGTNHGGMTCEACGKSPLRENTHSIRPDVLYRAGRPDYAVTCRVCEGFFVCGDCFNRQSYQHAPDHQLVLYAREERLAEQSPWPSRHRRMPPPPGPGRGGRPLRGPWG